MISDTPIRSMRRRIVETAHSASEGHIPSALSVLDILWILYDRVMNLPEDIRDDHIRDRFVLSKGHASLALYAVLEQKRYFKPEELDTFCTYASAFGGHPDSNKIPGVEASTGSLGHGLPIAVGLALGARIKKNKKRIFCLVGDGECNEGTIWESALLAAHHGLSNLSCIVDYNHSTDRALGMGDIADKFRSFEWEVLEISGHNHGQILQALTYLPEKRPIAVIAETVKGCGIPRMENNPAWHHRVPTEEEYRSIIQELS